MITTFLNESELKEYSSVKDPEVNELFQEVRKKFDGKYFLQTTKMFQRIGFFKKPKEITIYTLYYEGIYGWEYQIINFAGGGINTNVPNSYIITYFLGLINGFDFEKKKQVAA